MIDKILDTKAIEKIKDFRKKENYLYSSLFTEDFNDQLNRKYEFLSIREHTKIQVRPKMLTELEKQQYSRRERKSKEREERLKLEA
jgi:hypothetical protein